MVSYGADPGTQISFLFFPPLQAEFKFQDICKNLLQPRRLSIKRQPDPGVGPLVFLCLAGNTSPMREARAFPTLLSGVVTRASGG